MADILGIKIFVRSTGGEYLVSAYGNNIGVFDGSSTFVGQGLNLSSQKFEFDVFLDYLVGTNGSDANLVYDGTTWFSGGAKTRMPIASYVKTVGTKMYLANLNYASTNFKSRVWYSSSDAAKNNELKWGYETGTNLVQTAKSREVSSSGAGFKTYGIKTGDEFFITTGANAGRYFVDTIDSDQHITLTEELQTTATGSTFWCGSNWFDGRTNDGDVIKGLGENDNKLLVFKRESLHRYDEKELRRVKGSPGTTSHRSIVNIRENTYFFHDTGVYKYDGITSTLISRPIQDWIDGISSGNYSSVVGWQDGDFLYMYVGNITNTPQNINVSNGILVYDTAAQAWNIGSMSHAIRCATQGVESGARNTYLGNSSDQVILWNSTNGDMGTAIPWGAATAFHFPAKPYNVLEFQKAEVHTVDGRGVSLYYKLYGVERIDENWRPLGDVNDDVTKIEFSSGTQGRGIAFKFLESSTNKPPLVSRIDVFYKAREGRVVMDAS